MLDSVRCLMSVVMSPSDRADYKRVPHVTRRQSSKRKVRVHRISSRYPAIEVRTRMDSYGTTVGTGPRVVVAENRPVGNKERQAGNDDEYFGGRSTDDSKDGNDNENVKEEGENDEDEDYDEDDDNEEDEDDDPSSSKTDTVAGCSSASDTDFYYEDRSDFHRMHTTVVELRAEEVERTDAEQEEFEDSLINIEDRRSRRTVEIVTKHRHVLSDTCRVKVQNLRYNNNNTYVYTRL